MKRKFQIIISASAASVLAFSALAQDTSSPKLAETQSDSQGITQARPDRLKDTAKASDIIGMTVKNNQDEKLGTVENLAVDVESGRIVQVIISSGGFLGMGTTLTPVPPGALHHEVGQKILHLDASSEKFDAAPNRIGVARLDLPEHLPLGAAAEPPEATYNTPVLENSKA